jgi:two-component system chemotaxis sensor kinase CheA
LLALLASPGLSTAARVSAVSGRGVGLDAALARVRQLGGTLTLRTAPGAGTAFTLRLPVTLAVMRVLLVRDGALTCAVPVSHVRETLDAPPEHAVGDAAPDGEHDSSGRRLVRSRGARVPVVTLGAALAGGSGADRPTGTGAGEIVVVDAEGAAVGLHVDAVLAQREVVVKPFPRPRGALRISSGATILEDGAVAPILDVPALLQHLAR